MEVYNAPGGEVVREGCFEGVKAMGIIVNSKESPEAYTQAGTREGSHTSAT